MIARKNLRCPLSLGAVVLALSACSDRAESPLLEAHEPARNVSAADQAAPGQTVAKALASALAEPSVRVRIRNAMRHSPHFEHKLLLQEFIDTNDGRFVLAAAARASGTTVESLRAQISGLPLMDFYVPVKEHRLNWRGSANVVVGLNMDVNDSGLTGYTPAGQAVRLDSRDGVPAQTVIVLHPAEPRMPGASRRSGPGETIQDADEPLVTTSNTEVIEPSDGCCMSGEGGGGGTYKYLRSFVTPIKDGWGSAEVKFFMWRKNPDGTRTKLWDWRIDGVDPNITYTPNMEFTLMGSYVTVEEMDSWLTGDHDYWGESYPTWDHAVYQQPGFAASRAWTLVVGQCGPVYADDNWRAHCGSDGTFQSDEYAWTKLIKTMDVVFEY
ncbi:MAG: hypothetical protein KY444_06020 [Gemmatimonadetes bacterium]|nr:hypothetical protein [Gemmatimonadota bacterium]